MKLLKIDEQGYFVEDVIVKEIPMITQEDEEGNLILVPNPLYIIAPCQGGFYRPKWNGEEWVEGLDEQSLLEIEMTKLEQTLMPCQQEIEKAEREIETINLLSDLGVL